MTKRLQTIKRKMLVDRDVRAAYEALGDEFDRARELIAARVRAGLTQAEVAERMGTTQSVVARLEKRRSNAQREHAFEVCQSYAVASNHKVSSRVGTALDFPDSNAHSLILLASPIFDTLIAHLVQKGTKRLSSP